MNLARPVSLAATLLILSTGCVVGPDYSRPTIETPSVWKEKGLPTRTVQMPSEWWRIFHDEKLNAIETLAIEENQDVHRAVARVAEARAIAQLSRAELYPRIAAGGGYSRDRLSENRANVPLQSPESDDYSTSFDLQYELDVWGRVRRASEAASADALTVAANLRVVLLSITAEVARNYHLIRALDDERLVILATIDLRRDAVRLQQTRNQAGLINEMDVTRAQTELANVEAELYAVDRRRAQLEHALAVLCGKPPAHFKVEVSASQLDAPEIPPGLPSSLLQRRPDILEAEHSLQAASARTGVAKAAFFPTFKLTGAAGLASMDLGMLLGGASRFWSLGPSVDLPVFEGGRNRANLHAANARYEQAVAEYRATVLNAFREVEDSLSDLETLSAQAAAVNRALLSARDTASLADERYQRGLTGYLDVVDAQRVALQAERQEIQLRNQRTESTILLAKALGGSEWRGEE